MAYMDLQHVAALEFKRLCRVSRIIQKVEDLLVKCGKFPILSKRYLYQPGWEWNVFLVDVGEMEIERPQKNYDGTKLGSISVLQRNGKIAALDSHSNVTTVGEHQLDAIYLSQFRLLSL